jgi:hypothetical protein
MMLPRRGRPPKGAQFESDLPDLLDLWNRATAAPHGIAIESLYPNKLAQRLYRARRECGHNAYDMFRVIELEGEVRIIPYT